MKKKRKFKDPRHRRVIIQRVNTGFMVKLWSLHIYVVGHAMKERKRSGGEKKKNKLRIIRLRKLHEGTGCELCGRRLTPQTSELHHIKPQSIAPELKFASDNLMLLCHDCHVGLHKEAQKMAYELLPLPETKPIER